jgi:hypothetical protein
MSTNSINIKYETQKKFFFFSNLLELDNILHDMDYDMMFDQNQDPQVLLFHLLNVP